MLAASRYDDVRQANPGLADQIRPLIFAEDGDLEVEVVEGVVDGKSKFLIPAHRQWLIYAVVCLSLVKLTILAFGRHVCPSRSSWPLSLILRHNTGSVCPSSFCWEGSLLGPQPTPMSRFPAHPLSCRQRCPPCAFRSVRYCWPVWSPCCSPQLI